MSDKISAELKAAMAEYESPLRFTISMSGFFNEIRRVLDPDNEEYKSALTGLDQLEKHFGEFVRAIDDGNIAIIPEFIDFYNLREFLNPPKEREK
jgi:hypothetical protein